MDYAIIGGDERFACLAGLLEKRGDRVRRCPAGGTALEEALARAGRVLTNYPLRLRGGVPDFRGLLEMLPEGAGLWLCGPGRPEDAQADGRIVDLWADERLILDNAALTAEGAVAAAMRAGRRSLREMPALVVGWGRIGRALTELLVGMGAEVTVASRREAHRGQAAGRGAGVVDTRRVADALPGRKLIFNTAPGPTLGAAALRRMDPDAMAIDLASPPYGIDLYAAWAMGLRAWREPALPGRYCPESAAAALLRAIDRAEEGRGCA